MEGTRVQASLIRLKIISMPMVAGNTPMGTCDCASCTLVSSGSGMPSV